MSAMAAAIRERTAPADVRADYLAWLRARGIDDDDARALAAVGGERLLVYRSLVHNRLMTAIREFVPRAAARRGREALRSDFATFMELQGPRSPYLRDVPGEFVAWVGERWAEDSAVPDWLSELARHELLELDVRNDPRGGEPPTGAELALDRALVFDGSARLMRYAFAVHRLPKSVDDRSGPERRSTDLLVFRDRRNKVRYLELTPWAGLVLAHLLVERHPLADGLRRAASSLGEPLDDDKLAKAAMLFAELTDTGVLLGAAALPSPPDPG
jgi:hypothetical protein